MIRIIAFLLLVGMTTACGEKAAPPPPGPVKPVAVEVVTLQPTNVLREITVPGTIIPGEELQLYSEVSGRIRSIHFKEGQMVRKGALLVQVDTDILGAQKQQQLVDLELAKKDEARKKSLMNAGSVSQEEYERSAAELEAVRARIELINVQMSKAVLRAPFTGRIGLRRVSVGAVISPTTLITTLVQENPVKVEFAVAERYANAVKPGQKIYFKAEKGEREYVASVYAYEPTINAGTRMMTIRATLPNEGDLVPGSYVSIRYNLGTEADAFMVPAESVIPVLKGQKVLVVRNGKVAEIPVETGIRTEKEVQVTGDLRPGEQVLISGLLAVREGMPVTIKSTGK